MNLNGASFDYQTNMQQNVQFRFGKQNFTTNNDFSALNAFSQSQNMPLGMNMNLLPALHNPNTNNIGMNVNIMHHNNENNFNKKRKAESTFTCTICSIEVGSQDVLQSHMNGQKHAKRLRQIAVTKSASNAACDLQQPAAQSNQNTNTNNQQITATSFGTNGSAAQNKLYLQELNDLTSFHKLKVKYEVVSESGPQHAKQFEIKCVIYDPKTNVDSETFRTISTSINKAKQAVAEIALSQTKLEKPNAEQIQKKKSAKQPRAQFKREKRTNETSVPTDDQAQSKEKNTHFNKSNNNTPNNNNRTYNYQEIENQRHNKRFLLAKHIQIQPEKEQMSLIEQLITQIELAFKSVSDKLMQEDLKETAHLINDTNKNQLEEQARKLKGIFRVGPVEKGLLLKTDRELNLVVLTADIPTYTFVTRILNELQTTDLFKSTVSNISPSDQQIHVLNKSLLKLIQDESLIKTEACFYISYEYKQNEQDFYRVKVSFTSTKLDHDLSQINVLNCSKDSLPIEKCLTSIDEIRRTKWFNVKLKPIANAMLIMRIMRDFCRRTPTWSVLSDWLLEILVEKCFVRNKYEKVALKFRTVFECISSGIFFMSSLTSGISNGTDPGASTEHLELIDPCKKNSTASVFDYLTLQQKEDITSSAQHALRLFAFKKISQILALDLAEANLLFSSTTSSDKLINNKNKTDGTENKSDDQQQQVATDLDQKLNLLSQTENAKNSINNSESNEMNGNGSAATNNTFDYEKSKNFNENINNISMFILNNYASNIFDSCFNFLDLNNLKN